MGITDDLIAVAEAIGIPAVREITGALGVGAGLSQKVAAPAVAIPSVAEAVVTVGASVGALAADIVVDSTGFGGGNGRTATRTIVQTMDLLTGKIVRQKFMEGSPKLMNKDVAAAKKVIRTAGKLQRALPKKTVRESPATQLKDAVIAKAIRNANQDDCPPKC